MTTVQESPNGHLPQKGYPPAAKVYQQDELSPLDKDALFAGHKVPPPCSVPDLQYEDGSEDPTRNDAGSEPSTLGSNQLPDRCQFTFSDGRQCRMARSDIHPSLCPFHAEREDQLFGDPAPGGNVVGAALDLPELHSACRDLTTATGVNRALAQVFRLLAQRRISRQEAATFGHLAQLLLRTISLMRQENLTIPVGSSGSAAKGYLQDELSPVNAVVPSEQREPRDLSVPSPIDESIHPTSPPRKGYQPRRNVYQQVRFSDSGGVRRTPDTGDELSLQHKNSAFGRQPAPMNLDSSAPPIAPAPCSEPLAGPTAVKTSLGMSTCADSLCNSPEINTSENAELKAVQDEQLHNHRRGVPSKSPVRDDTT
jgi:hypothetical protein